MPRIKKKAVQLSKSNDFKLEYSAKIITLRECKHIEGTDALAVTIINDVPIIVNDTVVKQGDKMVYFCNETKISAEVLAANNQFKKKELNADPEKSGFFEETCRVKPIKLKGQRSFGFLIGIDFLAYKKGLTLEGTEIEEGTEFDSINGIKIVEPYIPVQMINSRYHKTKRIQRRINRFNRLIPNVFKLHYDTEVLSQVGNVIKDSDTISITLKIHGTSGIFSNIPTLEPIKRFFPVRWYVAAHNWVVKQLGIDETKKIPVSTMVYGNVYSSRTVIKNQYYNDRAEGNFPGGFYGTDIWSEVNSYIKPWLDKNPGISVYGEIAGYCDDGKKDIQPDYDYGCDREGKTAPKWKLMPYRITYTDENYNVREYSIKEVLETTQQIKDFCENELSQEKGYIETIPLLFYGRAQELYTLAMMSKEEMSFYDTTEMVIRAIKSVEDFKMEQDEPLCANKVPREGVVIRINNDIIPRAFKIKCQRFLIKESESISNGEWNDMEAMESLEDS